jgi:hypothetical protein
MRPLSASAGRALWLNLRNTGWAIVAAVLSVFILANAHLAYVAFGSQPDCSLQYDASSAGRTTYRAASPAC